MNINISSAILQSDDQGNNISVMHLLMIIERYTNLEFYY